MVFYPVRDAAEDLWGDAFFEEGEAAGLSYGVRKEAAEGGADGGYCDEENDVLVPGGVEDEHDVGDAGDGEWDEGAVDDGDEEEADDAEVEEEVDDRVVGLVRSWLRLEGEGGEDGGAQEHVV